MARTKLLVEGWRFLPHSYAIANQWQLLALCRHPDIELRVRDAPLVNPQWQPQTGLMTPQQEEVLRALPPPEPGFIADVTLRMGFPLDLTPTGAGRLVVFGTSEALALPVSSWVVPPAALDLPARRDLVLLTCSQWSAQGFLAAGIPQDRLAVVPLGVDPQTFQPAAASRDRMRRQLGVGGDIVFMNASAMSENKGIDLLLRAFAEICQQRNDVRLLLKGTDPIYASHDRLQAILAQLSPGLRDVVTPRLIYRGGAMSMAEMAGLYGAADVYVSPYRAEGFNLPVLEAMACGVPIICTAQGSTDDFVGAGAALKIASQRRSVLLSDGSTGTQLEPGLRHLTSLMFRAAQDGSWRAAAGAAARTQALQFTWERTVAQLLAVLLAIAPVGVTLGRTP